MQATKSVTGVGNTGWIPVSYTHKFRYVLEVSGTVTDFDLEYSVDAVHDANVTPTAAGDLVTAASAGSTGFVEHGIHGVRAVINAGTGTVTLTVIQGFGN